MRTLIKFLFCAFKLYGQQTVVGLKEAVESVVASFSDKHSSPFTFRTYTLNLQNVGFTVMIEHILLHTR